MRINLDNNVTEEVERRKQVMRDLWDGKPLEKVPLDLRLRSKHGYSVRETLQDGQKLLEVAVADVNLLLRNLEYTDAVPSMKPDIGSCCVATAFGSEYYWGINEEQPPGVNGFILENIEADLDKLPEPKFTEGWLAEGLKRISMFAEAGEGVIPIANLDTAGGVNVAADLMGVGNLLEAMYLYPEKLHELLQIIQDFMMELYAVQIQAAGGEDNICTTDFVDLWFPEGRKGHASDDICAMYSPEMYDEFSAPYLNMVYERFGCGGLHNCGPNPCAVNYVSQKYSPRCIDLCYSFSKKDFSVFRKAFKHKAFIYLYWEADIYPDPVEWYRDVTNSAQGDVIVVPCLYLQEGVDIENIYKKMSAISKEYAQKIEWGFGG